MPSWELGDGRAVSGETIRDALVSAGLESDPERRHILARLEQFVAPAVREERLGWDELHRWHHLAMPGCPLCEERA